MVFNVFELKPKGVSGTPHWSPLSDFYSMANDPAFLFYSSDFLSGVQDLTMEERGQYITLLCLQHQKEILTEKIIKLACGGDAAADVMAKFRQLPGGCYINDRLFEEIEKRRLFNEKQRGRAISGWNKRRNNTAVESPVTATALPLENENGIENENSPETLLTPFSKNSEQFPTMQSHGSMELSEADINRAIQINAGMTQQKTSRANVLQWWVSFRLINFDGKKYYADNSDIIKHFFQWVKTQKITIYATAEHERKPGKFEALRQLV